MRRNESSFTLGIFVTTSFSIAIALVSLVASLLGRRVTPLEDDSSSYVPTRFAVSWLYDTPAKLVNSSEKSWASAVTALLEAYYRHQGVATSLLGDSEYVKLSDRSLWEAAAVLCEDEEGLDGASAAEFLNIAPRALRSILPETSCPEGGACDITTLTQSNVMECEMKETHYATTVEDIKRLLYTYKRPLVLSMPSVKADFVLPCTDERVKDVELCVKKMLLIDGVYYGVLRTSTRLQNGGYFVPVAPAKAVLDGYDNFLLVGFNDDLHVVTGINQFSSVRSSKGAFIVKGLKGHVGGSTVPAMSGRELDAPNHHACLAGTDPLWWQPYDGPKSTPTTLECVDARYCDTSKKYWLAAYPNQTVNPCQQPYVVEDEYGLTTTYYYEVGSSELKQINDVPFWRLNHVFSSGKSTGDTMCGYWRIPYELVDLAVARSGAIGSSVVAFDMPVKWSRNSYAKGNTGPAYRNITASTDVLVSDPLRT